MSDSMQPSFITLDDEGRIGAEFTGRIEALGLDLPAFPASGGSVEENQIRWIKQSDGSVVAVMTASDNEQVTIFGGDPFGPEFATRIELEHQAASIRASVPRSGGSGGLSATIAEADASDDLLLLSSLLLRKGPASSTTIGGLGSGIAGGSTTITGNGSPQRTKDVAHGLRQTPKLALACVITSSPNFFAQARPVDATDVRLGINHRNANNFNDTHDVYWIAIA